MLEYEEDALLVERLGGASAGKSGSFKACMLCVRETDWLGLSLWLI